MVCKVKFNELEAISRSLTALITRQKFKKSKKKN